MLHLRRYLGALAVALAAYGCYAVLAAPWLEPAAPARAEGSRNHDSLGPVGIDAELEGLFEVGSWERDDPKIVETAQCTLLLKDYQPLPDGRIEIKPCTLIFFTAPTSPTGGASRRPIVLRAPAGAVLQFDRPIDVGRATVGRLMEGTLRGEIRIYSPPSRPGANDRLELTARNVKVDREKVYTPSVVQFRYGASFGHGRDLTITLLPEDKDHPQHSPSIGALSVLQLAKVERLHLEGASASVLPAASAGESERRADPANLRQELPLEVRCDGPLVVDFEQNVAALDENVEISRVYPQGIPDRLKCDRLIFHLAERTAVAKDESPALASGGMNVRQISEQVERVIALGTPVVLDAPQSGIFAKATRVEYATASKRIALESGPAAPQVSLKYGQSEFEAGEIEYEMAEPGRLGRLWAAGPGRLKFVPNADSKQEPIEATWQDSLTIAPHEKNKLVSLKGRPIVSLGQASSFAARQVHDGSRLHPGEVYLWLSEVPRQDVQPVDAGDGKRTERYAILPDRLLAIGQVEVDSPQLAVRTRELRTWFENQAAALAPSPAAPGVARFDPSPRNPADNPSDGSPRLQKLDVAGKLVQLQVIRRGDESAVEQLEIKGDVRVTERVSPGASAPAPLELTGEIVTLRHGTSANAKLEIHGQPAEGGRPAEFAKVSARGISLSGAMIHLRRADNRLWIPGRGEAILPMPMEEPSSGILAPPEAGRPLGTGADATNEPFPSAATRPLKVTWRDAFEFDGQKGVFSGAIEARGQSEFAAGEELNFMLNQRIDFAAPKPQGRAEIARLEILGGMEDVTMQRVLYDEQQQVSAVDNARVRNLVIDRTTGKLHASGPGEVWTVRRDLDTIAGGGLVPVPMAAGAAKKLSYVCVTFQGQIEGNLGRRQIEFQRQVDTIYGQVSSWNERVMATRAEDLGESGVHMQSDTLAITEMAFSPTDKWMEMDARGNTLAEGMRFIARAAQISYHSGKDVLSIKGDGRVPAEFWHRAAPGAQHSYVEAGHFIFHRATGSLEMGDAKSIDISTLPLGGKPAPRLR